MKNPVVKFPVRRSFSGDLGIPLNSEPVRKIDEQQIPHPTAGGIQNTFRLSITPWDLQKIIATANSEGLLGKKVLGFANDYDLQTIHIAPKSDASE